MKQIANKVMGTANLLFSSDCSYYSQEQLVQMRTILSKNSERYHKNRLGNWVLNIGYLSVH